MQGIECHNHRLNFGYPYDKHSLHVYVILTVLGEACPIGLYADYKHQIIDRILPETAMNTFEDAWAKLMCMPRLNWFKTCYSHMLQVYGLRLILKLVVDITTRTP